MRISLNAAVGIEGPQTLNQVVEEIAEASAAGFGAAWIPQMPPWPGIAPWDALTTAAVAGAAVPDIELGTSVVVAYTHHPLTLAGQALTANAAMGNRLTLGIGVSQQPVIEGAYGYPFDRPATYLREYLEVLLPALRGEAVEHTGPALTANGQFTFPGAAAPPVVLAALGPQMLRLAGALTDGTITSWTGLKTVAKHIVPRITAAAVGRPAPRVIIGTLVCVTDDVDAARATVLERFGMAASLPSYKAMLDIEGVDNVADVVLMGDERTITDQLRRYEEAGATEVVAAIFGSPTEQRRTTALLTSLAS
jgi:F420-dependent oxidoreductase-like protein